MILDQFMIEPVKHNNINQIDALTKLHLDLLPASKPSKLGKIFLEKFYLSTLIKHGCINGYSFRIKDKYVGFTLFTKYPNSFIYKAFSLEPFKYILIGLYLVFTKPIIMYDTYIKGTKKIRRNKTQLNANIKTGQWLTFAVKEEYLKHISKEGIRVSQYLVNEMINWFSNNNFSNIIAAVRKNNLPAIFFYKSMGFNVEDSELVEKGYYFLEIDLKRFLID